MRHGVKRCHQQNDVDEQQPVPLEDVAKARPKIPNRRSRSYSA